MYRSFRTNAKSEGSVWNHQSIKQFDKTLQECEWRFEIDGLPTIIPIKDCGVFVKEVVQYYITLQCEAMIDQMISGLQHSYQHVSLALFFSSDTFTLTLKYTTGYKLHYTELHQIIPEESFKEV